METAVHAEVGLNMLLSATVPLGTPGRVRSVVWLSDVMFSCLFKGLPKPVKLFPRRSLKVFSCHFRLFFSFVSDIIFDAKMVPVLSTTNCLLDF